MHTDNLITKCFTSENGGKSGVLPPDFLVNFKFQNAKLRSTIDAKFGGCIHISSYDTS